MPRTKDPHGYADIWWQIVEHTANSTQPLTFTYPTRSEATRIQQEWYAFLGALADAAEKVEKRAPTGRLTTLHRAAKGWEVLLNQADPHLPHTLTFQPKNMRDSVSSMEREFRQQVSGSTPPPPEETPLEDILDRFMPKK